MDRITSRAGALPYFLIGLALCLLGALAILHIVDNFWPIDTTQLDLIRQVADDRAEATDILRSANVEVIFAFLAAVMLTITGLVLPLAYFLNKRFGRSNSTGFFVVFRQAVWVGLWVAACTWLQMNRSLGLGVAVLVAGALVTVEILLQIRTRAAAIAGS